MCRSLPTLMKRPATPLPRCAAEFRLDIWTISFATPLTRAPWLCCSYVRPPTRRATGAYSPRNCARIVRIEDRSTAFEKGWRNQEMRVSNDFSINSKTIDARLSGGDNIEL